MAHQSNQTDVVSLLLEFRLGIWGSQKQCILNVKRFCDGGGRDLRLHPVM